MGTVFEDACVAASNSTDTVYAECWFYIPMVSANPNVRRSADISRPSQNVQAVFIDPYARAFSGRRTEGITPERPGHSSSRPTMNIAVAQLPYDIRTFDRAQRLKDNTLWEIAEVKPDGVGVRAMCDLNLLSGTPT